MVVSRSTLFKKDRNETRKNNLYSARFANSVKNFHHQQALKLEDLNWFFFLLSIYLYCNGTEGWVKWVNICTDKYEESFFLVNCRKFLKHDWYGAFSRDILLRFLKIESFELIFHSKQSQTILLIQISKSKVS